MASDIFSSYFGDESESEAPANDTYSAYFEEASPEQETKTSTAMQKWQRGVPLMELSKPEQQEVNKAVGKNISDFGAGFEHGVRRIPTMLAEGGAKIVGNKNLASIIEQDEATRNSLFQAQTGNSGNAKFGDFSGNLLASSPALGGIGKLGGLTIEAGSKLPFLAKTAASGISNALEGGAFGALNPLLDEQPIEDRVKGGAVLGGALGTAVPVAYGAGGKVADWMSGAVDPAAAKLAVKLKNDYGIDIPSYQLSSNPTIQKMGSILERLGLTKGNHSNQQAMSAVGKAIGHEGETSGLTEQVMNSARTSNSKGYDEVLDKIGEIKAGDLDQKLASILDDAETTLDANQIQPLRKLADKILNNVKEGDVIPAKVYKDMIKKDSILDRATNSPTIGRHAEDIEDALRDSLRNSASEQDLKTLTDLDYKWKNMRTVEKLAAKSDASGQISLSKLTAPVNKSYKDSAYKGAGALGDIAKGARTFGLSPSSGTAENALLLKMATGGGVGALDVAGLMYNPLLAAKVMAVQGAGIGMARGIGAGLTSDWYKNHLLRSAFGEGEIPATGDFGEGALLSSIPYTATAGNRSISQGSPE